jgi:maleamate amidohydrolase
MAGEADFEDHCWRDLIPAETIAVYRPYRRETYVGDAPAVLAIDLYAMAYEGGPGPIAEVSREYPSACGEYAWAAIEPTKRLLAAARAAGLPIVYTTNETRPHTAPETAPATRRRGAAITPEAFRIHHEFEPRPDDLIIYKLRASAFFGTALATHLTQLGVRSLIVCGESTSGCVRASVVDAFSHGFHVALAEEACFDRSPISHKVNLFDMHHKYADVMRVDEIVAAIERRPR